jgi:tetratricopeptide (TPR) repeat protein
MKLYTLRRILLINTIAACALLSGPLGANAAVDARWMSINGGQFLLVGDASESELRGVAVSLEQFRGVLSRLPSSGLTETQQQTTVLIFRNQSEYEPFAPLIGGQHSTGIAGHFQWSPEVNYVAFSAEQRGERSASSVAIHEYVHGLVKNSLGTVPVWFDEGLAEYYSTFALSEDGRKAIFGRAINSHAQYLREHELMPLATLLAVNHRSPEYMDHERRGLFYAESWALIHYLLHGGQERRQAELLQFLDLQAAGLTVAESVRQAFQEEPARLEEEFRAYVRGARYAEESHPFEQRLDGAPSLRSRPLAESEAEGYKGDLLLRAERLEEAEKHLQAALSSNPDLAPALTSLGLMRLEQNLYAEAQKHLARALLSDPQNFLAHYYYAELLSRDGEQTDKTVAGYILKTGLIRAELKRVIALKPDFPQAYQRLAEIDVQRSASLDETIELLQKASALWPVREEFTLLLARVFLRREEHARARRILDQLSLKSSNPRILAEGQNLLAAIKAHEEYIAARRLAEEEVEDAQANAELWATMQPCDMPEPGPQIKHLRFMGKQVCGQLEQIECEDNGSILSIESGGRTLKFHSADLKRIKFISYTAGLGGRIECGERHPANQVLLTYRSAKDATDIAGEVVAVEFVPQDWSH